MSKIFKERVTRDQYGFAIANNGLEKYYETDESFKNSSGASRVIANGGKYAPSNKRTQQTRVSDLFSSSPNGTYERECNIVNRKVMLNKEQETKLENSNKVSKLFEHNRYAMSVDKNNSRYIDIELMYSPKGASFNTIEGTTVYLNTDIDSIEKVDVPLHLMVNKNLLYEAYKLYKKHQCGDLVEIAYLVFGM